MLSGISACLWIAVMCSPSSSSSSSASSSSSSSSSSSYNHLHHNNHLHYQHHIIVIISTYNCKFIMIFTLVDNNDHCPLWSSSSSSCCSVWHIVTMTNVHSFPIHKRRSIWLTLRGPWTLEILLLRVGYIGNSKLIESRIFHGSVAIIHDAAISVTSNPTGRNWNSCPFDYP